MKKLKEYALITIGVILVSISIECFLAPNKIAAGGTTGISIIINSFFPSIPIGILMLIMELILFVVAFIFIGSKFGAKTIYSSLSLSGMILSLEKLYPGELVVTNNLFLASVFGVFISAIGMAIVFNQNASTGGTDILAKILNKYAHLDIGKALLSIDFIVTIFAAATFGAEIGMYAILCVVMNGFVIDAVIEGLNICKQVMVISLKNNEISKFIMEDLDRGCTILEGKGAFSGDSTHILYAVLSRKEFIKLKNYIKEVDENAFITVSDVHEVLGNGFKDIFGEN
jgi:uncharacterized membrane-anchored protein YitT (DUF2179 family)